MKFERVEAFALKILMHYRHFPVSIGRYLKRGLQQLGHDVFSVGCIDVRGLDRIPWSTFDSYPQYSDPPQLTLPDVAAWPLAEVLGAIPFSPDLIVQAGDISGLAGKASVPNVIVMTDPHCVDYRPRLRDADLQICTQGYYQHRYPSSHWVPHGYDEEFHYFIPGEPNEYDTVMIGQQYEKRLAVLRRLQGMGFRVYCALGQLYHEGTRIYNRGIIAFNWSSSMDLSARFFEGMAYKRLVVTNRLPDIERLGFQEGAHYVGFQTEDEAVEKCAFYSAHPDAARAIAERGHEAIKPHSWRQRAAQILSLARAEGLIPADLQ